MTKLDLYGLLILAAIVLPIPFIHRWSKRPRIGRVRKYWRNYVWLTHQYRQTVFNEHLSFREARILWFDPPLKLEFYKKARWVREQHGKVAVEFWKQAITYDPKQVVCKEPEQWKLL